MSDDCDHENINLDNHGIINHAHFGDRGLPSQITHSASCANCGADISVDYNIAFINGDKA